MAATFEWEFEDGTSLSDHARLDTMVTLVDAAGFLAELVRGDGLAERDLAAADGDERTISDLLVDQVEFADVLVVIKTDLVTDAEIAAGPPSGRASPTRCRPGTSLTCTTPTTTRCTRKSERLCVGGAPACLRQLSRRS